MSSKRVVVRVVIAIVVVAVLAVVAIKLTRSRALVAKVTSGRAVDAVPGNVTVRAEYAMDLKSEIGGRIVETALDEGKVVKEGDFLLQLDPTDTKLEIDRIDNDLKAAQARLQVGSVAAPDLENAKADLENAERQFKNGSLSNADLQKQQRAVTQLEKKVQLENVANQQSVENLTNELKTKKRQLEKMHMTAFFDGKISAVNARKGDLIGPNQTIATVISTSRTVEVRISEENFSGVKVGERARVRFLPYGNEFYDAKVTKVLPTADPDTQRYIVFVTVNIDPEKLIPGVTGEASIVVGERDSKALIPRRALFQHYVYVVKDGIVEQREVEVGYTSWNQVEILKGLEPGELVIVEELDRFHPGDHVNTRVIE
jgi:RND family efflux transporter MFP subunit